MLKTKYSDYRYFWEWNKKQVIACWITKTFFSSFPPRLLDYEGKRYYYNLIVVDDDNNINKIAVNIDSN